MHPAVRRHAGLIVTVGDPKSARMLSQPRRSLVRAQTYSGHVVEIELAVVATAPGLVCVQQPREDQAPWNAWIRAGASRPL